MFSLAAGRTSIGEQEQGREVENASWVATNLANAVSEFWFVPAGCGISLLRTAC